MPRRRDRGPIGSARSACQSSQGRVPRGCIKPLLPLCRYPLAGGGFANQAAGFQAIYATAGAGGHDVAYLYGSAGNDTFVGGPSYSYLVSSGVGNQAGNHAGGPEGSFSTVGDDTERGARASPRPGGFPG